MKINKIIITVAIVMLLVGVVIVVAFMLVKPTTTTMEKSSLGFGEPAKQDLSFAGVVNGQMTSGQRGDNFVCLPNATGPIIGKIGGADYSFEFTNIDGKDPGSYDALVQIIKLPEREEIYGDGGVKLVIGSDLRSGSVNGELSDLKDNSRKVRITGTWQCPSDI